MKTEEQRKKFREEMIQNLRKSLVNHPQADRLIQAALDNEESVFELRTLLEKDLRRVILNHVKVAENMKLSGAIILPDLITVLVSLTHEQFLEAMDAVVTENEGLKAHLINNGLGKFNI